MEQGPPALESMGLRLFGDAYRGRRVLVTGHTGFKGSWLALWLTQLGASVAGVALDPRSEPNHWSLLRLAAPDHRRDIRERSALEDLVAELRPDIVFHLAAQSLVRRSYREPVETWSTNVMGTAHVLSACQAGGVKAAVIATTDKVYANREDGRAFYEEDPLGGHDPYSASKAACELLVEAYRKAFFGTDGTLVASARAGNVIGGGDWSEDRLFPDAARAMQQGVPLVVRSPDATRPWQHVLESLSGYLLLGAMLLDGRREHASAWNFGPALAEHRKVGEALGLLQRHWPALKWTVTRDAQPHEAALLHLDNRRAQRALGWRPVWSVETAVETTAEWYSLHSKHGTVESPRQLARYVADARAARASWVGE